MSSGNFDFGHWVTKVGGIDCSGEAVSVEISEITSQDPQPIRGGGGRVLAHAKQSAANHRTVTLTVAFPSSLSQKLKTLAADQTDTTFSFAVTDEGAAQLPDGEMVSFTSDKVCLKAGGQQFNDAPGERTFVLSCIGFVEDHKNAPSIRRVR